MSIDKVRAYFKTWHMDDKILEFPVSSATVELAAKALNCEPCRIAKTLSFKTADDVLLLVTAGDCKVDNVKYKHLFHTKARMLNPDEVLQATGFKVGGVCPFAVPENVKVYLDVSLKRFTSVFPACGTANSAIELTPQELDKYTLNCGWVDVCK